MKSGLGLGGKQCWNKRASIVSVQGSAWVYVIALGGYVVGRPSLCAGGQGQNVGPSPRSELWNKYEFRPLWTPTDDNWWKKEARLAALDHSISAAARI